MRGIWICQTRNGSWCVGLVILERLFPGRCGIRGGGDHGRVRGTFFGLDRTCLGGWICGSLCLKCDE